MSKQVFEQWMNKHPELTGEKYIILMSEGLGSYSGKAVNDKHPKGRLGAQLEVYKNGKLIYETKNASTLPDDPGGDGKRFNDGTPIPTLNTGIYNLYSKLHKGKPACELEKGSQIVPVIRKDYQSESSYINLHHRGLNDSIEFAWSCGCLTVLEKDFKHVLEAVGITKKGKYQGNGWYRGKIIIDRSYIDKELIKLYKGLYGKAFFNGFNVSIFTDIKGHWAETYINNAALEGMVNGYSDGSFKPDQPITRAEMCVIVNRLMNSK